MDHPRTILERLGAAPLKRLGQNFLLSPHWAQKLVDTVCAGDPPDEYWEIGPGLGALTEGLVTRSGKTPVRLFEFDRKLAAHLRATFPTTTMHEGDVLDADLATLARGKHIALLSNLPFQISSPILFRLLPVAGNFTRLVLTFQREFAERLVAAPGSSNYGSLSVTVPSVFHIESLGVLPPGAFFPAPDIDTQALILTPKAASEVRPERIAALELLSRGAFAHRRKKAVSNFAEAFPKVPRALWEQKFAELGLIADIRPERISHAIFLALADWYLEQRGAK